MKTDLRKLAPVERDRVTAAEICIDEILTIFQRHGLDRSQTFIGLMEMSSWLNNALLAADGATDRRERLIRIRRALTEAIPMTDEDLGDSAPHGGQGGE